MARILEFTLNGRRRVDAVPDNLLLLDYLREVVGLTGTKTGCDGGECGACTVLVDDRPRLSCLTLAASVDGQRVDTVELLGTDGHLSAVQRGFHEKLGAQCGYCTPGFHHGVGRVVAAQSASERGRHPRGARQQHLPLHRLREDHRGGEIRGRAPRRPGWRRERDRAGPQHRRLRADGRRAGEGLGSGEIHRRSDSRPACSRAASTAAPIPTARSSRSMSPRRLRFPA